jgi:hypothetical protein
MKDLKQRWWKLWSKDAHAGAACDFCGRSRADVEYLIEGKTAYLCSLCVAWSLGAMVVGGADAKTVAVCALEGIVTAIGESARYATVEPILETMLTLSTSTDTAIRTYHAACARGHFDLALRALDRIPVGERSSAIWHDMAAMALNLERLEVARAALHHARNISGGDDLFAECHSLVLSAHMKQPVEERVLAELRTRVFATARGDLKQELLEGVARHRQLRGDRTGAIDAANEALALGRKAPLLILRGDLLAEDDRALAVASWQEALEMAHPDSVFAGRATARLEVGHPYRSG